jgi:hypothetical protein
MKELKLFTVCFMILTAWGCNKNSDKNLEPIPPTPSLRFISMVPGTAVKYQDEIKIKIEYTDGDGDLGENTADVKNLFCTDSRNNVTYEFRINQLAPDTAHIAITGELTFTLPAQGFIDDSHTSETTTYSIHVKDRAGNESNTVQTSTLTINQ